LVVLLKGLVPEGGKGWLLKRARKGFRKGGEPEGGGDKSL
jgi:hypothetical protein